MSNERPNQGKTPQEHISDALDRLAEAGWVSAHGRSDAVGVAVNWTDDGTKKAEVLWALLDELNFQGMSPAERSQGKTSK